MTVSQKALEELVRSTKAGELIRREGQLQLFEGEREYRASLPAWDARKRFGIRFDLLEHPEAIADIQPGLDPRFTQAGFTPDWINTTDPKAWLAHLRNVFLERGGVIEAAEVTALEPGDGAVTLRASGGGFQAKQVVVAAGAWSHHLARSAGDHVPLETERGYNTTLPAGAFDLRTHLSFSGHGFVVTRIGDGVRVGGAVELGGLNLPANFKRADTLLQKARTFLPELNATGGTQWMGYRPSLPDSLPVIDHSKKDRRIVYAFGHGHLGLTQSAGTAELVTALVQETEPAIDVSAYSVGRF